jgi:predicted CXXCH cytochrome family protein
METMRSDGVIGGAMKKHAYGLLAVGLTLAWSSAALAYSGDYVPGSGINGTVHDLSVPGANGMNYGPVPADSLQRICIFCHAPHNTYRLASAAGTGAGPVADSAFDYLPLWNHTLQTNTAYQMYDNGPGAPQQGSQASQAIGHMVPGSSSLLCLSCHDGSVAVNSYGNGSQLSQSTGNTFISPAYQIGKDKYLGNHHPIGFNYDAVQSGDTEIRSADTAMLTPTTFVRDHLLGEGNTMMECDTCHSVHNKGNTGERLLWRSDQNSELCLTCHDKGIYTAP